MDNLYLLERRIEQYAKGWKTPLPRRCDPVYACQDLAPHFLRRFIGRALIGLGRRIAGEDPGRLPACAPAIIDSLTSIGH